MICHICKEPGANIPDPCCGAPDCKGRNDYAHFHCMSPAKQREEELAEAEALDAEYAFYYE